MTKRIKSHRKPVFTRPALADGNRAGKMPIPTGKWVWPPAAIALGLTSFFSAKHIENQVELAAPEILQSAGVDSTTLEFDASYRHVDVSGTLPGNVNAGQIETLLAKYSGPDGQSIRRAQVVTTAPATAYTEASTISRSSGTSLAEDVRITATVDNNSISLHGTVPTQDDADLLYDAATQSFAASNINNELSVSNAPSSTENTEQSINGLATVLSNLDENILDAHIDIDNDLMTGNITTANAFTTSKVKAYLPSTLVNIITDSSQATASSELASEWNTAEPVYPEVAAESTTTTDWVATETNYQTITTESLENRQLSTDEFAYAPTDTNNDQVDELQNELNFLAADIKENVVFAPGSDTLQSQATTVLNRVAETLNNYPAASIEIGGHTDSQATNQYNLELSQSRAQAVAEYLVTRGIDSTRLNPTGYGESQPIATNDTTAGRARNRRVELVAY